MDQGSDPSGVIGTGIKCFTGKNDSECIEQLLPWSDFMKEHCTGLIDVENITTEKHEPLPI